MDYYSKYEFNDKKSNQKLNGKQSPVIDLDEEDHIVKKREVKDLQAKEEARLQRNREIDDQEDDIT